MIWKITSDISFIISHCQSNKNILVLPKNDDEVIERIRELSSKDWKDFIVLDNKMPSSRIKSLFVIEEIELDGFLTTQEKHYGVSLDNVLKSRLGLEIKRPKIKYSDMKGFEEVIKLLGELDERVKKDKHFALKPIFLLGMAGTGKSRVAEAYAGENDIPLIDISISSIAESPSPIAKLHENFNAISKYKKRVCLRLDEFEQMSSNEELLGEMLTILNDLNKGGYDFNGMMFFTSNNISEITYKIPQFFRHGRFAEKLFISFPKKDNAIAVMKYFNTLFELSFDDNDLEKIFLLVENAYKEHNFTWQENRSPYTPAEYEALFSVVKDKEIKNFNDNKSIIKQIVLDTKPLLVTAQEGVQKMYQKAIEQDFRTI